MVPECRIPSIKSFIRFNVRRNVDLPQPDGPINATTVRSGISKLMSKRACLVPYQKLSSLIENLDCLTWTSGFDERPLSARSVMIAENESVDTERPVSKFQSLAYLDSLKLCMKK